MGTSDTEARRQSVTQERARPDIPDFSLLKLIGRGSYGEVWLARSVTGAFRAVKVVHRGRFGSEMDSEREFRGIEAFEPVSRTHPNLLQVLHVGRNDINGYYFYVMELADDAGGRPITDAASYTPRTLRSIAPAGVRLPICDAIRIVRELAAGLAHLHGLGLVHRDIKPSNIVFVDGVAKLGDAGLVARSREEMSCVGTEGYIPPEGMGKPQADVYGLGRVLYEISTGRYAREFPEVPTDLPTRADKDAFKRLNAVILRACDPDPRCRFKSAAQLANALSFLESGIECAPPMHQAFGPKRPPLPMVALLVLLVALIVGLVLIHANRVRRSASDRRANASVRESPSTLVKAGQDEDAASGAGLVGESPRRSAPLLGEVPAKPRMSASQGGDRGPLPGRTVTADNADEFLGQ